MCKLPCVTLTWSGDQTRGIHIDRRRFNQNRWSFQEDIVPEKLIWIDNGVPKNTRLCYRIRYLGEVETTPEICLITGR